MMFLTFIVVGVQRRKITVNVTEIEYVSETDKGSLIRMRSGRALEVTATHDEVLAHMNQLALLQGAS